MGGHVRFDHELVWISQDGKELNFKNGKTFSVNHLASCDGVRSIVRDTLFGSSTPIYSGFTAWRGINKGENDNIEFNLGSNNHLVSYPINHNLDRSFVAVVKTDTWSKEIWKQKGSIEELYSFLNSHDKPAYTEFNSIKAVSYTHLTLPTIYSV